MSTQAPEPIATATGQRLRLVLLATTDLHANLRPYNYYLDREDGDPGLASVATLVRRIRTQEPNCLLVDNGDTLQGSPLGDLAADGGLDFPHPMIAAMNALGYDAATVGNHDFNYGLAYLQRCLADAAFAVVLANLDRIEGDSLLPRSTLLTREFADEAGNPRMLRIGILGLAPPQITKWDRALLAGQVVTRPIVESAIAEARALRRAGADLIVALCHSGIGPEIDEPDLENALLPLAASGAVDAIVAGHTHKRLPAKNGPDHIHGIPVVQPGFFGTDLGKITLELKAADADGWRVARSSARLLPVRASDPPTEPDPTLMALSAPSHQATLAHIRRPIGMTKIALETYFALAGNSAALSLVADATLACAREALDAPLLAELPLLSAAAPFKAGGRGGPDYYTDISAGPLSIRHAADLYAYPNSLQVVRANGAALRDWLERAASAFHRIEPGSMGQALLDRQFSSYNFDVIFGLCYQIDLAQRALYSADGETTFSGPGRIRDLSYRGEPVRDEQEFLVVTNSYRAAGGGHFPAPAGCETVLASTETVRDVLARYIERASPLTPHPHATWRFVPLPGTSVIYETGPGALTHKERIRALGMSPDGRSEEGFLRFHLPL